jgi:hypothetical protein
MQAIADKILVPKATDAKQSRNEKIQFILRFILTIPLVYVFLVDMINTLCNQNTTYFSLKNTKPPNEGNPLLRLGMNANSMIAIWVFMLYCYIYIIIRTRLTWKMTIAVIVLILIGIYGHTLGACTWIQNICIGKFTRCAKLYCIKPTPFNLSIFYAIIIPALFGVILFACFLFIIDMST